MSNFRRGVSKAQWAVSGLVAPLSGASSGVSRVALAVARVDAQEVVQVEALAVALIHAQEAVQVVEQKNFQHGLVVSESESSMINKVTFTEAA